MIDAFSEVKAGPVDGIPRGMARKESGERLAVLLSKTIVSAQYDTMISPSLTV